MNPELFIGKDWTELIGDEFSKDYMVTLGNIIKHEREQYTIYPETSLGVFEVFRGLSPNKVKIIIVGQD
jgi:uracil DNA glycosylase